MAQLDSPLRRVLGNKSTNASMRSQVSTKTSKKQNPVKDNLSTSFNDPARLPKALVQSRSARLGQKRKVEEVEEPEELESQQSTDTQRLSQVTDVLSDGSLQIDDVTMDSTSNTRSTAQTSLTSFHASQAEEQPAEFMFEIHEEMSQPTLDNMHEVSLPQNTSQPANPLRPSLLKEVSQVSVSMSSLIDFDDDKSSQHTDGLQLLDLPKKTEDVSTGPNLKSEEVVRKESLAEKAESLRIRLQLAFYKVSTNQIAKPFSRLDRARTRSPELPPQPFSSSPASSPPARHAHFSPMSPESRIAIARARATMQAKRPVKSLDAIQHPTIVPTAFSARHVERDEIINEQVMQTPSSLIHGNEAPPFPTTSGITSSPANIKKKMKGNGRTPMTPMQLSSPPGSPIQLSTAASKLRAGQGKYEGLTSSVVKGEAANGLLELMRGAAGSFEDGKDEMIA